VDYDMFGYGIREDDYVAAPSLFRHRTGMRIYQYKDGKYYPKFENALKWFPETGKHEPYPRPLTSGPAGRGFRLDRSINLTRFDLWEAIRSADYREG
jgi:hypothetical protein